MKVLVGAGIFFSLIPTVLAQAAALTPLVLTNAEQMLALTNDVTGQTQYVARLKGVVIYVSPATQRLYIQDGKRGVQINLTNSVEPYRVSNMVEVTGTVLRGEPTLRLGSAEATVLSNAPLPTPKLTTAHRLVKGEDAFRYVKIQGMVRDMFSNKSGLTLLVTQDGYPFEVAFQTENAPLPRDWTDAEIEVSGICYPFYNAVAGRSTSLRFHATSTNYVRVITPGVAERFDGRPLLTIAEATKLPQSLKPRYRIAGTVTACRPGAYFFIEDGTGVMLCDYSMHFLKPPARSQFLEREPQTSLQPGERVEVVGARHNWYSLAPSFMASEFRRMGRAEAIKPIEVKLSDLLEGRYAGQLVTLKAQLVDQRRFGMSDLRQYLDLVLHVDDEILQAKWESETSAKWELPASGYVQITGVNDAEGSATRKRGTFKLLLRSPADVVPTAAPPFWVRNEFQRIASAVSLVAILAGAFIVFQRWQMRRLERRVADRTVALREEVAAREAAQEELRVALEAEKELGQLKSSFVSMVSHEFRTPLEVILSSSNILDRYLDRLPPEKRKTQLRAIRKSVHRMNDLIEDVLMLGKLEAGRLACNPAPLDVGAFCRRAADEIESATGREGAIQLKTEGVNGDASADETLLHHILTNLLGNAIKYSPPERPVEFTVARHGNNAEFVIRDRGCGIPVADQARLFTAFYRGSNVSQTPGSGLGLVIVKRCVDLHDGTIRCESIQGRGTTFTVTLPLFDGTRFWRRRTESPALGAHKASDLSQVTGAGSPRAELEREAHAVREHSTVHIPFIL